MLSEKDQPIIKMLEAYQTQFEVSGELIKKGVIIVDRKFVDGYCNFLVDNKINDSLGSGILRASGKVINGEDFPLIAQDLLNFLEKVKAGEIDLYSS